MCVFSYVQIVDFSFLSFVFECVMCFLQWYAGWCGVTMSISSMPCILWRGSGAQHDVVLLIRACSCKLSRFPTTCGIKELGLPRL
jgi:hypothetical protein